MSIWINVFRTGTHTDSSGKTTEFTLDTLNTIASLYNERVTTQNLTVVKLIEEENLILVQGSVPGSKNGIILLSDAYKIKLPENVPYPAGLFAKLLDETVKSDIKVTEKNDVKSENLGGDVEA